MTQPSRAELVERLIKSESRVRLLERTLREHIEWAGGDRSEASYVLAQQARIQILETNVERLINEREKRAA